MFQLHFAEHERRRRAPALRPAAGGAAVPDEIDGRPVERMLLLYWEEHCVECAVPECYGVCPLYRRRRDGACRRFAWGIGANRAFSGSLPFGADIAFRRWGKLEASLGEIAYPVSPYLHRALQRLESLSGRFRYRIAHFLNRRPALKRRLREGIADFDEFVVECHAPRGAPFRLLVELFALRNGRRETLFRDGLEVRPGRNLHRIPAARFLLDGPGAAGYLHVHPEGVAEERRVVFTRLEFVRYARDRAAGRAASSAGIAAPAAPAPPVPSSAHAPAPSPAPAPRVKVLAWDLDRTLWDGVLVESDPATLALRPGVRELIETLDARGVLQTVASKNDAAQALPVLERLGVADYFLFPAINWGQKSESLKRIAAELNLGPDAFALIDDSPFERAEVASALPQVRVYAEDMVARLATLPEFDHPATPEARARRASYRTEARRRETAAAFRGDYGAFLASCGMRMRIFRPRSAAERARCLELLRRSNQLNLRTFRYDEASFAALLADPAKQCVAFACADRFGDYGIVGFASLDRSASDPLLLDLVISCRVARKRVEHALLLHLARQARAAGAGHLLARFVPTDRNAPLSDVFRELPFERSPQEDGATLFRMALDAEPPSEPAVAVEAEA